MNWSEREQRNQITEITAEKGSLVDEKKKAEGELAQQKKRVIELTTGRHSLLKDIGGLRQQIAQKDNEHSNLRTVLNAYKEECGHLKDLVQKMREALQAEKIFIDRNSRELAERDNQKKEADAELHGLRTELQKCKEALERKAEATRLLEEGHIRRRRKQFAEAYELFDKSVVLDIDMLLPYYHKAGDYYAQADYEGCIQTCKLAMAGDRGTTTDKYIMAALYSLAAAASVKRASISEAGVQQHEVGSGQISHLEDAVEFYGKSLANYYDVNVENKRKRYAELLRQAYTNPKLTRDALAKGNAFFESGQYEKALGEYDEAVNRYPSNARLYRTRAWCHLKLKSYGKAILDCNTALKQDPTYAAAYTMRGMAQQAQGHRQLAEMSYKKALELDPVDSEAERAQKDLQSST
ncbi:stress-induced-phosphoprotein 1 [Aphelenchoides avenae]|nr:stress-induced-phosphoprotein 1 [Aphelenchus avenae]